MEEKFNYGMFAASPDNTHRINGEEEHIFRSKFERDRDRILYSKEFRRLSGKTQVFVTGFDDRVRTRLTHTLEVSQITTTICKALRLNDTLGEAIAIGHDIGHTPFGHVGERTLNYIMNGCDDIKGINNELDNEDKGFKHNWQGLRVVMDLEEISKDYRGLNLTEYTLWGILNHSKKSYKGCERKLEGDGQCSLKKSPYICKEPKEVFSVDFYDKYEKELSNEAWTVEALIARHADEIAQRHHDIEDALVANIIDKEELVEKIEEYFKDWFERDNKNWKDDLIKIRKEDKKIYYIPMLSKLIVDFLTTKFIDNIKVTLEDLSEKYDINNATDFNKYKEKIYNDYKDSKPSLFDIFSYEEGLKGKDKKFQKYLSARILNSFLAQSMDGKSSFIIRQLIKAYVSNPQQLPDKTIVTLYRNYLPNAQWDKYRKDPYSNKTVGELRNRLKEDHFKRLKKDYKKVLLRTICDYIAGMTDKYAIDQYTLLYGSRHIGQM